MTISNSPRRCERRTSKLLQLGQHRNIKNRSWDMVVGRTWHPNPVPIGGQSRPVDSHRVPESRMGRLRLGASAAEPDFVRKTGEATMKFRASANFDRVREYGIMMKRNHLESTRMERKIRCVR